MREMITSSTVPYHPMSHNRDQGEFFKFDTKTNMFTNTPDQGANERNGLLYNINSRRTFPNGNTTPGYNHYHNPYNPSNNTLQNQNQQSVAIGLPANFQSIQNSHLPQIRNLRLPLGYDMLPGHPNRAYANLESLLYEIPNAKRAANQLNYVGMGELASSFPNPYDMIATANPNALSPGCQARNGEGVNLYPLEVPSQHTSNVSMLGKRQRHDLMNARDEFLNQINDFSQCLPNFKNEVLRQRSIPNNQSTAKIFESKKREDTLDTNRNIINDNPSTLLSNEEEKEERIESNAREVIDFESSTYLSPCIFQSPQPTHFLCYEYPMDTERSLRAQIIRAFHALYYSTDIVTMEMSFLSLMFLFRFESREKFVSVASDTWNNKTKNGLIKLPEGTDENTCREFFQIVIDAAIALPHLLKRSLNEFLMQPEPNGPGLSKEEANSTVKVLLRELKIEHIQDTLKLTESHLLTYVVNQDGDSILSQSTVKLVLRTLYSYAEQSKTRAMLIRDLILNGSWPGPSKESSSENAESDKECEDESERKLDDEDGYDYFQDGDSSSTNGTV